MFFIWVISLAVACACVALHYEMLNGISIVLPKLPIPHRRRVTVAVLGVLVAHILEIYIFAAAIYLVEVGAEEEQLISGPAANSAVADNEPEALQVSAVKEPRATLFSNAAYLSFTTFTSLGYGDVVPVGNMRILAALEVLTGLLTIAWSASFIYVEMNDVWPRQR
ncbi:MAG: potassium channel family protein [Pirellulales bacterium]|nr:two pore domain potassium channel family protein [Planctomycetales bacterium]